MIQYPHRLLLVVAGETYRDERGEWHTSEPTELYVSECRECRESRAGSGTRQTVAGGEQISFSAVIYLPRVREAERIIRGAEVVVKDGWGVRLRGEVLQVAHEQLHTRLWVS